MTKAILVTELLTTAGLPIENKGDVSDGYHTFNQLYDHRIALWILVTKLVGKDVYKTRTGDGWMILGMVTDAGQIGYHIPDVEYDRITWASESAPEYDGHTSEDAIKRIWGLVYG